MLANINVSVFWSEYHPFYSAASHQLYWACLSHYRLWWLVSHLLFPYGCAMVTVSGFLEGSLIIVKMLVKLQERKRFVVPFLMNFATWHFLFIWISVTLIYLISLFGQNGKLIRDPVSCCKLDNMSILSCVTRTPVS